MTNNTKKINPNTTTAKRKMNRAPKDFDMYKAIRGEKIYKDNIQRRDKVARKYVDEKYESKSKTYILPGQLIMFNYFEPKLKEQLEYYDAMPCTIFFGIVNTKNGKRVIGFNIHYYPPRIRYKLLSRIYEIFKPIYSKCFTQPLSTEMDHFNYKMLTSQLQKAKLDFGIREYIPMLMGNVTPIPTEGWSKAVFTEGHFRKETRDNILNYWKNKSIGIDKSKKDNKSQADKK